MLRQSAKQIWPQLFVLVGSSVYLYIQLFTFSRVPFLLTGDQNYFWAYALRMLRGERIYRDFFQFTPPGADLFFATLFRMFGARIQVANLAVLFLGAALCWLCFLLARRMMSQAMALLATALILVFLYSDRLDATHHWFSLMAALCAVKVLMPERTAVRVGIAGCFLGLCSFFTQTAGIAGAFAILVSLAWERKPWRTTLKQQILLLLALCLTWSALSAPFIAAAGWRQFWYLQVTYPRKYVNTERAFLLHGFAVPATWRAAPGPAEHVLICLLLLGIYPFVLRYLWRSRKDSASPQTMQVVLLSMMGLFLLLEVITRMNWIRLYVVATPAMVLLVWLVERAQRVRTYAIASLLAMLVCAAGLQTRSRQYRTVMVMNLPAGKTALSPEQFEEISWLKQHTKPGDTFFQGCLTTLYMPLDLHSPVFVDSLWANDYTRPEWVTLTIQQLEQNDLKYVLWFPRWTSTGLYDAPSEDHLDPFRSYLRSHYVRVHVFSNQDEVWERQ